MKLFISKSKTVVTKGHLELSRTWRLPNKVIRIVKHKAAASMVELHGYNVWQFEQGVDRIRSAFESSITIMEFGADGARQRLDAYEESGEDEREYEYDDQGNGYLVYARHLELEHAHREEQLACEVVRQAFISSVFHFWERSARDYAQEHQARTFDDVLAAAKANRWHIHSDLDALNTLNNYLKHNNPKRKADLLKRCPELFRKWFNGDERLAITNDDVRRFMDVVKASRPPVKRPPRDAAGK